MGHSLILLKAIGKAALNFVGGGVAGDLVCEVIPDLATDAWKWWHRERNAEQRRLDVATIALATPADCQKQINDIVLEIAGDKPPAQREALALYLSLVPGQVRKSLRRPSDPTGTTVPFEMVPNKPADLINLLPTRLPRFKPGDRPLPGVDWQLDELLGIGGFGEVWRAKHTFFDGVAPVALKFCLEPSAAQYLRNEAAVLHRIMQQGRHPGIIPLQHTYLSADSPCLEYEYVAGGDLAGLIQEWHRGGKPDCLTMSRTMHELATIMAHAHSQAPAIVHRDLKPANVLREVAADGRGQLKVADFGIGGVATRQAIAQQTRGTAPGLFLATALRGSCTPLYASPQQMRGEAPDPRDDVYALGVIWYQMLTGDLTTGRPGGTRWQRRLEDMGLERRLVELLGECLEDGLDDRVPDAAALARRLGELLPAAPVERPIAPPVAPSVVPSAGPQWRKEPLPEPTRLGATAALAGKQLRRQEESRRALAEVESELRDRPDDPVLLARRGEAHRQLGKQELAIADCTEAIRLGHRQAAAYATRGSAYRVTGQLDLAIADCGEALRLDAASVLAWSTRAEAHRLRGDLDKAIADSTRALELDAAYASAYGTRGAAWQRKGDFPKALADLDDAIRLDPANAWALVVRGDVYRSQRDFDRAIADCTEALRVQPESSFAYTTRGAAFRQKGDFATAMADLNQALRLRPDNQFTRDQLELTRRRQR